MSEINVEETEKLKELCLDAIVVDARRCSPILCASANPKSGIEPQIPVYGISHGDVCIATTFYSTGHSSPDCDCDISKITQCPYRRIA